MVKRNVDRAASLTRHLLAFSRRQLADEAHRRRPDLKVLFTTGYARNAIVHHGRLDPGVDLLMKPFSQADMAGKIRRVLGSPQLR